MKQTIWKRTLSMLLALVLMFELLPLGGWATETTTQDTAIEDAAGVTDYLKLAWSGIGHFHYDMVPYYLTGKSNTREQFEEKIRLFD